METTTQLMPIGRFARLTGLTVKALRHYDELGLLRPASVDPEAAAAEARARELAEAVGGDKDRELLETDLATLR